MASAKKIRDEIMTMTIVVNSNPAQQEIYSLTKRNRELTEESKRLKEERQRVGKELGRNSQEYKDLTQKINDNTSAVNSNNNKIKELSEGLDVTEMNVKQLRQELSALNRELERTVPGSEQYNALNQRIGEVSGRLSQVRNDARNASQNIDTLSDRFNQYAGIVTVVIGTLVGFGVTVQEIIDKNNKMADAMSGVEKTTGLAKNEVEELTKKFADFDTRTKKIDLLKIAEVGGRLGVAKKDIASFTQEVDKAYVALGDSWKGGVDSLADSLGRIASLYNETKDQPIAKSINEIGSAVNELAAQGASSEQNIADFVNRLGSLPPAMKPALNTLLGFGSAFEESGINAEIASSGFAKFVRVASSNAEGFADIMRLPVARVKEMINTDPAGFFLRFSEGLNGLDSTVLQNILSDLKLSDNEVQRVIGAAAENTDRFRDSVKLANEAVAEGTSLQNEFDKMNTNAAATYEKLIKAFSESKIMQVVAGLLDDLISLFAMFLGVNEKAEQQLNTFGSVTLSITRILGIMVAALISANAVIALYNILIKDSVAKEIALEAIKRTRNATQAISNGLQAAYNIIIGASGLLINNTIRSIAAKTGAQNIENIATERAIIAQIRLNAAMSANPIGAVLAVLGLLIAAYYSYKSIAGEAEVVQKNVNEVMKEGAKNAASEVTELDLLYKKATKAKEGTEERRKAIEELQKKFPSYFGNLDIETAKNEDLRKSYERLREAIIASARAEAAKEELKNRMAERLKRDQELQQEIDAETGLRNNYKSKSGQTKTTRLDGGDGKGFNVTLNYDDLLNASRERLKKLQEARKANRESDLIADKFYLDAIEKEEKRSEQYRKDKEKNQALNSNYKDPGSDADKQAAKDAEKLRKKQEREAEKQRKLKEKHDREMAEISKKRETAIALETQIELDLQDAKIAIMEEGFDKEIALINLQEQRKAAELDKKKIGNTEIDLLQEKIDKAVGDDKRLFEALMDSWIKNNKDLEDLKLNNMAVFNAKRKAAEAKSETDRLKEQDEAYQKEVGQLQRQKNDEIAKYTTLAELKKGLQGRISDEEMRQIKTWQDGKEALTKVYQKKEIDLHVAHLQSMISLYEGLDMTILNKEQQKQVISFIDEAKNKISELKAKANETTQGDKDSLKNKTSLGNQGSKDILGMSISDWETFFSNIDNGANKLGTITAAVSALQNAFSTYYSFVQQREQAQMRQVDTNAKRKEARLKRMLDNGQINQEQYEAAVQRLNQETEMEKYKLEYDAARRQRNFMIAQTHANTAMAIMNIWATAKNPWVAAAMSFVVGALGLIQVGNIAKQPLPEAPGFEDGFGMTYDMKREQDGKTYSVVRKPLKSGPVYRPTHFIAGEGNKVEMVIDSQTYRGFSPGFRKALNQEIAYSRGASGYEMGHYPYLQNNSGNNESIYAEALNNNTVALNKVATMTPRAYVVKDMDSAKTTIEMIEEYNSFKNQAKKK